MSMPPPMVLYVSDAPLGFGKNTPLGIKVTKGICCPLAAAKAISKAASRKTAAKALRQYRLLSADPLLPTRDRTWRNMPIETTNQRSEEHSLNSSHSQISYAVFCLKKKKKTQNYQRH